MPNSTLGKVTWHNKKRIAQQFSRAATTYDSAADVQLDIAFDAISYLPSPSPFHLASHYGAGLDIGCGTGRISQKLISRCDKLIAVDLAFGMLRYAKQNNAQNGSPVCWVQGDADCLPLADNSIDMVFSSMALQWSGDPQSVMSEITRVMKPNSTAILAIMCDGSFSQLNDCWQQIDSQRHVNHFASAEFWCDAAKMQGLRVSIQEKQYITWHSNIRQLLSSIKSIGANVVLKNEELKAAEKSKSAGQFSLNRNMLQHLETYYQRKYAENMHLPLTYNVCFLQCSK